MPSYWQHHPASGNSCEHYSHPDYGFVVLCSNGQWEAYPSLKLGLFTIAPGPIEGMEWLERCHARYEARKKEISLD
jgi:hypothetical protein